MKTRKLIYLLQLEEYDTERYLDWLKKNDIEKLEERKNHLKETIRVKLTFLFTHLFSILTNKENAVAKANEINKIIFGLAEEILVKIAKLKLCLYPKLTRIVITGSYGKTTFKEMLSFVLEDKYKVLKTPENINTRIGIANLIIKKLNKNHQILVVEAGAYKKGEIKNICELIKPDFGIITIFGMMHLERFKSIEAIRKAKSELIPFIKDKSKLFIPKGLNKFIDFQDTIIKIAKFFGIKKYTVQKRLNNFKNTPHRLEEKTVGSKIIILDDTYNSNPLGFKKALDKLKSYRNHQKILVTPGMIEFGPKQYKLNFDIAKEASEIVDIFIIVGQTNQEALIKGAKKQKSKKTKIISLKKEENIEEELRKYLRPPSVVLLENELPDHYF